MNFYLIFWGIFCAVCVLIEVATAALVSIWFVAGALAAFALALCGWGFLPQWIVFTLISIITLLLTRPFVRRVCPKQLPTNADRLPGSEGRTLTEIDPLRGGRIFIGGLDWRAFSSDQTRISADSPVIVDRIEGVTAYVTKK